jgi:HAE1 family hydrophobic/amphiphilic exporter-1
MNLAAMAIKRPVLIVMMVLSIITLGILGFNNLAWDLMPNVEFPSITTTVIYPGASAEEMENLVAKPLEDAFTVLEGIDKVTTSCRENMAMITTQFKMETDIKFAEIKVRDKVALVKPNLPVDIQEPVIQRINFTDIPILFMSLSGKRSSADLRDYVDNEIKDKIETVPGVGSLSVMGGQERQVKITVDKALLLAKGVSVALIENAINMKNTNIPVGVIKGVEKNITVRVIGQFKDTNEIANLAMTSTTGKIIRIGDIAKVEFGLADQDAKAIVGHEPAVMFFISKQSGANSVKVAENVLDEVKEIQKTLPADLKITAAGDTTRGIKRSVSGVLETIVLGAILAVLIVFLFLGNFRSAIITAIALPDSIIGTFFLIWIAGFTLNTITLMSLALVVGLLIDDSIVVRENIFRHIEMGMSPKEAAEKGTNEVGLAVISTTLSILAVFIPISFLTGMVGQFFRQFGLTVAFALLVSLLDAFTTAPMLSAYWYEKKDEEKKRRGVIKWIYDMADKWSNTYDELTVYYRELVAWAIDNKKKVWGSVAGLFAVFIISFFFLGSGFMTNDNGFFMVSIEGYPGAPLEKTDGYLKDIEDFVGKQKSVESYFTLSGSNGTSSSSNQGMVFISMKPMSQRSQSQKQLQQSIRDYIKENKLDKYYSFTAGSSMGSSESTTPILVNITGPDLGKLAELSLQVKKIMLSVPGVTDVDTTMKPGQPEMRINVDGIRAEKLGMTTVEIGMAVRTLVQGAKVTTLKQGEKEYDINIRLDEKSRRNVDDLKNITITTRTGKKVPLTSVCDFVYASSSTEIRREDKERIAKISADAMPGYNGGMLNSRVQQKMKEEVKLPEGYAFKTGGMSKEFHDLAVEMSEAMLLAILFMYMILASLYNSFTQPLIIMVSVLLALMGGPIALLICGMPLDVFGFIGLLMVLGLAAKNGILLIDFTNKNREKGMSIREALLHAAPLRLRPILMTSLAMIFGMLPIALSIGEGSKGREGLAVIVIGGLITSTLFTLVTVPVAYDWMENVKLKNEEKKAKAVKAQALKKAKKTK